MKAFLGFLERVPFLKEKGLLNAKMESAVMEKVDDSPALDDFVVTNSSADDVK